MVPADEHPVQLPSAAQLAEAIETYLQLAYEGTSSPPTLQRVLPADGFDPGAYLMSDAVERTPPDAALDDVRAFAIRLGNCQYPNMKLRLSRPPKDDVLLLSVDSHDAMLQVPPDSPDYDALEAMKAFNAELAGRIQAAWDHADLPTEKRHLREAIDRARDRSKPSDQ
jgi:hypothetical protein